MLDSLIYIESVTTTKLVQRCLPAPPAHLLHQRNPPALSSSPFIHRFLALGMKPAQFFINHCATFDEPQEQRLPITTGQFDKLDVFFNSVTHLDTTLQKLDKIFMSIFLYQCFKESGYFDNVQIDCKILHL